jgi:hypothetical protein
MKAKDDSLRWIPLWVDKWIFGSTRIELQHDERAIWVDLMALASKDNGYVRANPVTPYSILQLSGLLCATEKLLVRSIRRCIETGKILDQSGIYYLVNWDQFKLSERQCRRIEKHARDIAMATQPDIMATQPDTMTESVALKKSRVEESRVKNKELYGSLFLSFWNQYPKKFGKPNAFREWNKIKPDIELVVPALKAQIEFKERLLAENKFCPEWPDPERWIKNRRWEDELQDGPPSDERDRMLHEMKKEREKDEHPESA